jgi:hypothetical protein
MHTCDAWQRKPHADRSVSRKKTTVLRRACRIAGRRVATNVGCARIAPRVRVSGMKAHSQCGASVRQAPRSRPRACGASSPSREPVALGSGAAIGCEAAVTHTANAQAQGHKQCSTVSLARSLRVCARPWRRRGASCDAPRKLRRRRRAAASAQCSPVESAAARALRRACSTRSISATLRISWSCRGREINVAAELAWDANGTRPGAFESMVSPDNSQLQLAVAPGT